MEAEFVAMLLAFVMFFYLNYPGVRDQFMKHELALMTPEQRAAVDQMQAAQMAMAKASVAHPPPRAGSHDAAGSAGRRPPASGTPADVATRRAAIHDRTADLRTRVGRSHSGRGQPRTASTTGDAARARRRERRRRRRASRCRAPSGTTSRWRFANATLRRTSSSIAASRVSSCRRGRPTPRDSRSRENAGSAGIEALAQRPRLLDEAGVELRAGAGGDPLAVDVAARRSRPEPGDRARVAARPAGAARRRASSAISSARTTRRGLRRSTRRRPAPGASAASRATSGRSPSGAQRRPRGARGPPGRSGARRCRGRARRPAGRARCRRRGSRRRPRAARSSQDAVARGARSRRR